MSGRGRGRGSSSRGSLAGKSKTSSESSKENSQPSRNVPTSVEKSGTESENAAELARLERRLEQLELEKCAFTLQVEDMTKLQEKMISELEKKLDISEEKRKRMQESVESIDRLQAAIVQLFLEFKDRSMDGSDMLDLNEERRRLMEENPFVIIEYLGAHLRFLLRFKEDYEADLKDQIEGRRSESENRVKKLQESIHQMEKEQLMLREQAARAEELRRKAEELRVETLRSSDSLIDELKKDNERLIAIVQERDKELDDLVDQINERDTLIRKKEMRLMKIAQLESQIEKNKIRYTFDVNRVRAENNQTLDIIAKNERALVKLRAEKEELDEELKRTQIELASYKRDANRSRLEEAEGLVEKLQKTVDDDTHELQKLRDELRHSKRAAEEAIEKCRSMKADYDRVFKHFSEHSISQRSQKKRAQREVLEAEMVRFQSQNESLEHFYKLQIQEKDEQIEQLTRRVRRLLLREHSASLAEKSLELERSRLEKELISVQNQGASSRGYRPKYHDSSDSEGDLPSAHSHLPSHARASSYPQRVPSRGRLNSGIGSDDGSYHPTTSSPTTIRDRNRLSPSSSSQRSTLSPSTPDVYKPAWMTTTSTPSVEDASFSPFTTETNVNPVETEPTRAHIPPVSRQRTPRSSPSARRLGDLSQTHSSVRVGELL